MTPRRHSEERLVRTYVVTDGRAHPTRNTLEPDTLLIAVDDPPAARPRSEKSALLDLCRRGALSVAEAADHLELPVSVMKVLVADLVDDGLLVTRAPVPAALPTDPHILQEVLDALRGRL